MCPVAPPSGNACQDASHPYYDVARHGILQVTGNDLRISTADAQLVRYFTDVMTVSVHVVSINNKGQDFSSLVSMYHHDCSMDQMCL